MNSFFRELKQRKVYRVALGYAVVAWLIIQISATFMPAYHAPEWILPIFITVIALGFPVALVLAWAFELKGGAIEKAPEPTGHLSAANKRRVWLLAAFGLIISALAIGGYWLWHPWRNASAAKSMTSSTASESSTVAKPGVPNDKSVPVLPFANLSRDPDNAYFAAGIQDEIITRLAKITELEVISCTSTQRFKSAPDDLPAIAKQLGVANILEGSVQRTTDQLRVNVQLVEAATDAHLWAETYDRKLTDIFGVESDIAKTIADTLQAKLTGSEKNAIAAQPTENTEAHEFYPKGRYFWNKRTGPDLRKAIDYFKQAIDKDPKYALAYAGLADSYTLLSAYGAGSPQESFPSAKTAAQKALELDDTLAEAHTSLGQILLFYDLDLGGSTKEFERAIALNPNYATAHHWYGSGPLLAVGEFDRAIAELRRAQQLDPLSLIINADLGVAFATARRYDEAIAQLRKTIEMDPRFYYAHWNLGVALELKGELREALAEYKEAAELDDDPIVLGLTAHAYAKLGERDQAVKLLAQLHQVAAHRYVPFSTFAGVYMALGEKDKAIDYLERAYRDHALSG